ncbi:2-dehydropantoate 2-reductase [Ceratobasidium sp. AG-Ba]|nr:2-dehydropantoate 2-reductase [Ceratobasidium sp. AG-Ba]
MVVASSAVEADRAIAFPTARITGCVALVLSTLDDGNEFPKDLRGWLWRSGNNLFISARKSRSSGDSRLSLKLCHDPRTRRRCAIAEIRVYLAWRPHRVVDSVENAALAEESFDYIVCTFKCLPDLQTTPQILGIELDLQQAAPGAVVMSGCAWIDATIIDHGRTLKHGPLERLVIGVHPSPGTSPKVPQTPAAHTALAAFVDLLKSAGFGIQVVAVARAQGVNESDLPLSSIDEAVDLTLSEYGVGGPPYKASMLVDFLAERPMEIEVIIGGVLRYAHGSNVPTPRLSTAYALLKVHQTRFMQKSKPRDA